MYTKLNKHYKNKANDKDIGDLYINLECREVTIKVWNERIMKNLNAAYFLLRGDYFGRPLDDGVIQALLASDYKVDIFAPDLPETQSIYPHSDVRLFAVEYRLRWLISQLTCKKWKQYHLFLGTSDLPMAIAGILAMRTGRNLVTVCDEIFIGGYQGNANWYWKLAVKRGMRKSAFTVITDPCRMKLQRQYAGLGDTHRFVQYPCCYCKEEYLYDADFWRKKLALKKHSLVLSLSGHTSEYTGAHWVINTLDKLPSHCQIIIQPGYQFDPLMHALFKRLSRYGHIVYIPGRMSSFVEAMSLNQVADIGLVFYLSPKPQFQEMGVSSNKLCMYLQMGKPVIANKQESFRFLEEFGAGVLIEDENDLIRAVIEIEKHYTQYSQAAYKCYRSYIQPKRHFERLNKAFSSL